MCKRLVRFQPRAEHAASDGLRVAGEDFGSHAFGHHIETTFWPIRVQSRNLVDLGNMPLVRLPELTKLEDLGFKGYFIGVVRGGN